MTRNGYYYFAIMAALLLAVGVGQSWNVAFGILNLCLISAVMALGVNIQWGFAGLFNVGIMDLQPLVDWLRYLFPCHRLQKPGPSAA